ncbi:HD domain-containing protein [Desulforhopalus singaporensis]|uniref:HD domain-containing protein n=1 Tax=Desulforhopalus singaporensis TaxID=91360 RepID=A0A1H0KIN9_9BACT|nr:HD domain-containing protein [Desulforhopalus singaporensis]SDO55621.1 uncharacterized protein SAMN05660330_00512 [Desulforhopalus singaporensis]
MKTPPSTIFPHLDRAETALKNKIRREEAQYGRNGKAPDSLWNHVLRVARLAQRLGVSEGVDPLACRLAGIFHDAGKFRGGAYHHDDRPEEEWSVTTLREITGNLGFEPSLIEQVEDAILQLYRNDPEPTPLTRILFDADNLDKLGRLGVANYFIKEGLRGRGISASMLYRITIELTYARHAPHCLATATGRQMAAARAPETREFFSYFLDSIRQDGLYDFIIEEVDFNNLTIDVVAPRACECGNPIARRIWEIPGIKCSEIHLEHSCTGCSSVHELKFCRPRLAGQAGC